MPETNATEFLQMIQEAFIEGASEDAEDRFVEFVNMNAEDDAIATSVMEMIDRLDDVRRKFAFDAVVAVVLNTPRASVMHQSALEKWDTLIERIAEKDIFSALDWAAMPCLWSGELESLHVAGLKKWEELLGRAAAGDFDRALAHARDMENSDPRRPFAITAKLAADLLERKSPGNTATPRPSI
ncbi:MAG TPA: hypothetical protein VL625_13220 [Patescibacteria group bacterium]|nr:hypothetical protein [Patescibacteria group bacterium]